MKGNAKIIAPIIVLVLMLMLAGIIRLPSAGLLGTGWVLHAFPYQQTIDFETAARCGDPWYFIVYDAPSLDYTPSGWIVGCDPGGCSSQQPLEFLGTDETDSGALWGENQANSYYNLYLFKMFRIPWDQSYTCSYQVHLEFTPLDLCGNSITDQGEQCDGSNLGGNSCLSLGYDYGDLSCTESCTFDTSNCGITPDVICGNDLCEPGETSSNCPEDCGTPSGGIPIISDIIKFVRDLLSKIGL